MRKYIRHPSDIPIDFQVCEVGVPMSNHLIDISLGGLCFIADRPLVRGTKIHIHIPVNFQVSNAGTAQECGTPNDEFDGDGIVAWCRKEEEGYAIGVQFSDSMTQFGFRMVEQVCHIEHYRYDILQEEGRHLSAEEAAQEWVERYAAEFPAAS